MKQLIVLWLLTTTMLYGAAAPVIYYIDHTTGVATYTGAEGNPDGIYLTIDGNNFGNTRGTSSVAINGVAPAQYITWTNNQIGIQISHLTTTGAVTVTTTNGTATGPTFTVRSGSGAGFRIFYVGPGVDNTNPTSNCTTVRTASHAGTFADPWQLTNWNGAPPATEAGYSYTTHRTPFSYNNCMTAGDVLVFLDGVFYPWWDGRGLHGAITTVVGTSGNPMIYEARPGATVTFGGYPYASGTQKACQCAVSFVDVSGITFESANNVGVDTGLAVNVRLVNNDVQCPFSDLSAGCVGGGNPATPSNVILYGNKLHNITTGLGRESSKTWHAIYFNTSGVDVGWNAIWNTRAYNGYQIHHDFSNGYSNQTIHDNYISDLNGIGINFSMIEFADGTYVNAYNNVIAHTGKAFSQGGSGGDPHGCIAFKGGSPDATIGTALVYNNIMYDCSSYLNANNSNDACALIDFQAQLNITRQYNNNIIYQPAYTNTGIQNVFMCSGGGSTNAQLQARMLGSSNNIFFSATTPGDSCAPSNVVGCNGNGVFSNPLFNNLGLGQLWPGGGSPAIAGGVTPPASTTLIDGEAQTSPPVIGAYLATTLTAIPQTPLTDTTVATGIGPTTATAGGSYEVAGSAIPTTVGTCWATLEYPHPGGANSHCSTDSLSGLTWTSSLTGMPPGAVVYYASYATNSAGTQIGGLLSLTTSSACAITLGSCSTAFTGVGYTCTVTTGGCASPTFSVQSGSLPAWAPSIGGSTGIITGTPSGATPTTSSFGIGVSDTNCAVNNSGACLKSLSIIDITKPTITTTSPLPPGTQFIAYGPVQFTATGDTGGTCTGCLWSATGLPTGMTLSSSGSLSGTPTVFGPPFTVNVTVTNNGGLGLTGPTSFILNIGTVVTAPGGVTLDGQVTVQ